MTRETKIGLLVGLAFIIVIGILLSDHLTSTTEPASAPLGMVGPKTRDSLTTLGRPTVPVTVEAPPPVTPRSVVVTAEENKRPVAPVSAVVTMTQGEQQAGTPVTPTSPTTVAGGPTNASDPLVQLAQQHGSELEVVGQPTQQTATPTQVIVQTPTGTTAAFKEYKAQEGDSLSRIASKTMGSGNKTNRDAIVRANPSLKDNPNMIVVGKVYLIPTAATIASAPPAPQVQTPIAPTKAAVLADATAKESGIVWYTVKENENLWKIAAEQLGSGNAWTTIKDMNKDVLKGGEVVRTNMRLRLPAKGAAKEATASARD